MVNYLEQGAILYVMAAICAAGIICKIIAVHFYKSLIKQSDNLALAKDRQLQQMKVRYESTYRIGNGVRNTGVYVEKMLQQYRLGRLRLAGLDSIGIYCGIAAFLAGGTAALLLYLNSGTVQACIMYLAAGSLMAAAVIVIAGILDGGGYREILENCLDHYFENVLVVRGIRSRAESVQEDDNPEQEECSAQENEAARGIAASKQRGSIRDDIFMHRDEQLQERENAKGTGTRRREEDRHDSQQRQLDELRESLAQIAAARGEGEQKSGKQGPRKLTPREEQLINDIINQYLS